jgi:hypothetical protein
MFFDTDIAVKETASSLIEAYDRNMQRTIAGYDLLIQVDVEKSQLFGGPGLATHHSLFQSDKEKALQNLRVSAWRAIVNNLGLYKVMSLKRTRTFDENCEEGKLPEINTENVHGFLEDVLGNAHEIAIESVREIYAWLRPGAKRHDPYKTNQKNARWKLGKKIILRSILDIHFGGRFWVSVYQTDYLRQLDRIMHLLDGAGIPDGYQSPLIDAINTITLPEQAGETTYFSFRCFQNGNLHLTFKRLDLVERLNATAGGGNVLGDG